MKLARALAVAAGTLVARGASADEPARPPVALTVSGCAGVDQDRLREALELELTAQPPSEWLSNLKLRLACKGARAAIEIVGRDDRPRTSEVPLPAAGAGRERTLALAISEAVSAADGARRADEEAHAPAVVAAPVPALEGATSLHARGLDAPPAPARPTELSVAVTARAHALADAFPTLGFAVGASIPIGRWRGLVELGAEAGASDADGGRVRAQAATVGVGVERRWGEARRLRPAFAAGALVAAGAARLSGDPDREGVRGESVTGATASVRVAAGPVWTLGSGRLGLELQAGWTAPNPLGRVVAVDGGGPSERSLGGAWAGLALRAGVVSF